MASTNVGLFSNIGCSASFLILRTSVSTSAITFADRGSLVFGVAYTLPGVFEANPYKAAVNGSLWSMPYEIRMYIVLALAWLATRALRRVAA